MPDASTCSKQSRSVIARAHVRPLPACPAAGLRAAARLRRRQRQRQRPGKHVGTGALATAGTGNHDHSRRLGDRARARQDRRRRRVRHGLCAGRGRFQPGRDQLPQFDGPARRNRRRIRDMAGSAPEAVHRPGRAEIALRQKPRLAAGADEQLGRRSQLLPRQASRRASARHHAFRTVDGAELFRGQHRWRHRTCLAGPARSVLRP